MALGWSALTIASHVALIVAVLLLFSEVVLLRHVLVAAEPGRSRSLFHASALIMAAFVIERLYYVAARLLLPQGVDLWAAHPAPELLSGLVALAVFAAFACLAGLTSPLVSRARGTVTLHATVLGALWGVIAWLLW